MELPVPAAADLIVCWMKCQMICCFGLPLMVLGIWELGGFGWSIPPGFVVAVITSHMF